MFGCCHLQDAVYGDFGLAHDALRVALFRQVEDHLLHHVAVDVPEHDFPQVAVDALHVLPQGFIGGDFQIAFLLFLKEHLGEGREGDAALHQGL